MIGIRYHQLYLCSINYETTAALCCKPSVKSMRMISNGVDNFLWNYINIYDL